MTLLTTATTKEFEDAVLKSKKTVLVDFWAEWCAPCRAMAPVLHGVAEKMDDTVDIIKVNIEASADNKQLAQTYRVQSIPNMVIFKGGKEVDRIIGMAPAAVLTKQLAAV